MTMVVTAESATGPGFGDGGTGGKGGDGKFAMGSNTISNGGRITTGAVVPVVPVALFMVTAAVAALAEKAALLMVA